MDSGHTSAFSQRFKAFLEKKNGILNFYEFMSYSLYDEVDGYYSADERIRVGKEGDFITSVSVGNTFARIIIERVTSLLEEHNPPSFTFLEIGPERGDFAADFLSLWKEHGSSQQMTYHAVERNDQKREHLQNRLSGNPSFSLSAEVPHTDGFTIIFGNEILDAFPVHLIRMSEEGWNEIYVTLEGDTLKEIERPLSASLSEEIMTLPQDLPIGYQTEICLDYAPFFKTIQQQIPQAYGLFFDYYLSEREYYALTRSEGTLQTYAQHQKNLSPLSAVGEMDMSCHVNFNRVKKAAETAGFTVSPPINQGSYLTQYAKEWLLSLDPTAPMYEKWIGEFKTLTLPSFMGAKFQVVEISPKSSSGG